MLLYQIHNRKKVFQRKKYGEYETKYQTGRLYPLNKRKRNWSEYHAEVGGYNRSPVYPGAYRTPQILRLSGVDDSNPGCSGVGF